MHNYINEIHFTPDANSNLQAHHIFQESAMVFMLHEQKLKLLLSLQELDVDVSASWLDIELSEDEQQLRDFDSFYNPEVAELTVCYVCGSGASQVKIATLDLSDLINRSGIFSPEKNAKAQELRDFFTANWQSKSGIPAEGNVNHISLNNNSLLIGVSFEGDDPELYYSSYQGIPEQFELPDESSQIIQLQAGTYNKKSGAFVLFQADDEVTNVQSNEMAFVYFDEEEDADFFTMADDEAKINCFCLSANPGKDDDLYLGGAGITAFVDTDTKLTVLQGDYDITKLHASHHENERSVWMLNQKQNDNGVFFLSNRSYTEEADSHVVHDENWTPPLKMHQNIQDFASVKGANVINQFFFLGDFVDLPIDENKVEESGTGLIHFWQDASTTHWHEHSITIPGSDEVRKIQSYTTHITFSSESLEDTFIGQTVALSATTNMVVVIEERKYLIGPNNRIKLTLESNDLHIAYPTGSIACGLLQLELYMDKKLAGSATIDPNKNFRSTLHEKAKDGDSLKTAKKQDGSPLISGSYSDHQYDQLAKTTQTVGKAGFCIENGQPLEGLLTEVSTITLQAPQGELNENWTFSHAAGSIWHAIEKGFEELYEITTTVESEGIKFALRLESGVFNWVCKTLADMYHFLHHLWQKFKVLLEDFIKFIGFLFKWHDILTTKDVVSRFANQLLEDITNGASTIKTKVDGMFEQAIHKVKQAEGKIDSTPGTHKTAADQTRGHTSQAADPRANWAHSKKSAFKHLGSDSLEVIPSIDLSEHAELQSDLEQILHRLATEAGENLQFILHKGKEMVQGKLSVGTFFKDLLLAIVEMGLKTLETAFDILIELFISLTDHIKDILNAPLEIPLFSKLYHTLTGHELTFLDFISLVIAVPVTVGFKLINGKAPFTSETDATAQWLIEQPSYLFGFLNQNEHPHLATGASNKMYTDCLHLFSAGLSGISTILYPILLFKNDNSTGTNGGDWLKRTSDIVSILGLVTTSLIVLDVHAPKDPNERIIAYFNAGVVGLLGATIYLNLSPQQKSGLSEIVVPIGKTLWGITVLLYAGAKATEQGEKEVPLLTQVAGIDNVLEISRIRPIDMAFKALEPVYTIFHGGRTVLKGAKTILMFEKFG